MSSALDMSLDDLIKGNKKPGSGGYSRGRGRGAAAGAGGGGGGPGPTRRFNNRVANRAAPYAASKAPESAWQHDMFADQVFQGQGGGAGGGRASAIETGTKLYISNLEYGVSNEDIKELFSEVGDLKRYSIHYDRSGRSKGTAEIVFSRRTDALAAVKRYNNVQLDGKPMKIEIVGTNIPTPPSMPAANGSFGNLNGASRGRQGRGGAMGRPRGGSGGGRGFGRGRGRGSGSGSGRGRGEKVSADDLDADLEKYHSEAMQTN
ncbi:THO complex subunit 4A [Mercurialis annua]|uniref:THO complex subunit 4A n=1 Tax=Mercurialis annua TaxID=3986 RepID=UPI002160919E|nr:THO complex subunit 4A [Mercurialis annua]